MEKPLTSNLCSAGSHKAVIGVLLFLMFINNLPETTVSKTHLFADDAVLYRQIKDRNDCAIMQNNLESLVIWEKK